MGSSCTRGIVENIRDELWSYFALSGLLFLNIGVVLMVYALKKATTHPIVLEVVGILLIVSGVMATLTSWYVHRQHRRRKPLCSFPFLCWRRARTVHGERSSGYPRPPDIPNHVPSMGSGDLKGDNDQTDNLAQDNAMRMFSTLEFQMYEEYTKEDNVRRERNETRRDQRRKKEESQRKKKQVHPKRSKELAQANLYVNAMYGQKSPAKSPTTPAANAVWLTVPR